MRQERVKTTWLNGRTVLAWAIAFIMFCGVFLWDMPKAMASGGTISTSGTYDISAYGNNSTITINSGLEVTLTNTSNTSYTEIQIVCNEGVMLTLDKISFDNASENACALSFSGSGNLLILSGNSHLRSGSNAPGIRVEAGTHLEISGEGRGDFYGGAGAAGIGAGTGNTCGTITISSGMIYAYGGAQSAGIGGSYGSNGGTVTITDGYVYARGGNNASGIGGSEGGSAGTINISGGNMDATGVGDGAGIGGAAGDGTIIISGGYVSARGETYGAGIGGAKNSSGGSIIINGGTVFGNGGTEGGAGIGGGYGGDGGTILISGDNFPEEDAALGFIEIFGTGSKSGAGIGGGCSGSAGSITITGGVVYADGESAPYDVGSGQGGSGGSLALSGSGLLFLERGNCITPSTSTHTLKTTPVIADIDTGEYMVYGFCLPTDCGTTTHVYLNESELYDLTYDAGGGTGTSPQTAIQYKGTTVRVADGTGLTKRSVAFTKWNTARDGLGSDYIKGAPFIMTKDTILYAVYGSLVNVSGVALSSSAETINIGDTLTLAATVLPVGASYPGVTWSSSNDQVASVNQSGVVTAKGAGIATITATADGVSATCTVSVRAKFNITAAANYAAYGNVSGGGSYISGASVTLNATSNPGYRFVRWAENGNTVTQSPSYSFSATRDAAYTAEFTPLTPVGISCSKTDATLYGGSNGSVTIAARGGDSGAYQYSINGGISWQNSNTFAGLPAGTYTAAVRDAGYPANSATYAVTVGQPAHIGTIPAKSLSTKANVGTAITIVPPASPKGYTAISVTFTSSNPSIAAVDSNGNITFIAGGKVTITTKVVSQMTDSKGRIKTKIITVKKTVTVKQPVASVSLNMTNTTIARTQKVKLAAGIAPVTASSKKVKWTSSNPRVASVSGAGVVTGKAGGTAVITCTAQDGSGAAASCTVTVTPIYPAGLKMSKAAVSIKPGKTTTLKVSVSPKNTDFKTVTWSSSNPAIASVDAKGSVRGVAPGVVTIMATTSNGYTANCTVTIK